MTTAVDLFAGCGGFSEGAEAAGVRVLWAANHWRVAVDCHEANHPTAQHACEDLHKVDWSRVPKHDILLASPCCQGHANARGKNGPQHDASRSTAWSVVECLEVHRPAAFVVENVPEMLKWVLYPVWALAMKALGYTIAAHKVDAADYGVPQNRVRLIIVGTRSKAPFQLKPRKVGNEAIGPLIDWDSSAWRKIDRTLAPATRARIKAGRARFGERFLTPYYGSGSGLTGRSIDRPVGTITTRDRWGIVDGDRMRMFSVDECRRAMGFPEGYVLPAQRKVAKHLLGNAICPPLAAQILREVTA